jgi:hypothetical protein
LRSLDDDERASRKPLIRRVRKPDGSVSYGK